MVSALYGCGVNDWRSSRLIAVVVFTVVLSLQLAIPSSRLGQPGHAQRFAWQMFSGSQAYPTMTVITSAGEEQIRVEEWLLRARVELDITESLPAHLCAVVHGAQIVTWDEESYRC